MEQRSLGRSAIPCSAVGFGCGSVGGLFVRGEPAEQRRAVERALEGGITYFDTAASYGDGASEENLGRTLRELGVDPVVGTKVRLLPGEEADAARLARQRLTEGLRRLGRERVDCCTLHGWIGGPGQLSVEAASGPVAEAMAALVEAGYCSGVGFTAQGAPTALRSLVESGAYDYFQCLYSLVNPSAGAAPESGRGEPDFGGLLAAADATDTGVMAIRVLAAGELRSGAPHPLAGALVRGPDAALAAVHAERAAAAAADLAPFLAEAGFDDIAQLALCFALGEPRLSTVLVGFSDTAQVEAALAAAARPRLSSEVLEGLRGW